MAKKFRTLLLILPFTFLSISIPSYCYTESFLFGGCTQQKFTPGSPYEFNVDSLLTSLVNSATYSSFNKYTIMGSSPEYVVYGLYQCRGDLSMPDCAQCVARAVTQLGSLCSRTCGGSVQLQGCFVKYDNVSFLGVLDKTVVLKKCGPSIGYDTESMTLRDAVLGSIASNGGLYRVGGSGKVQGIIQCTGDLSMGQCQDCVQEAVRKLKSDCGTAVYGDMFLAKCYARYTTGGAQVYSRGGNSSGKSNDKGVKTFAIIVGLLGAVALLIIFLTFIRKIMGGGGK
ncbi:hypothetical protein SAY86_005347 [Trapa natans]|uniref:Gnk2-homologous domain-containing protein n=1 Tax=Trapa natans TaxID=22666 RepID=A0AAN7QRC9_TRANT|nr:hypothetical protein SAY86_005347 [Trapa natans]